MEVDICDECGKPVSENDVKFCNKCSSVLHKNCHCDCEDEDE